MFVDECLGVEVSLSLQLHGWRCTAWGRALIPQCHAIPRILFPPPEMVGGKKVGWITTETEGDYYRDASGNITPRAVLPAAPISTLQRHCRRDCKHGSMLRRRAESGLVHRPTGHLIDALNHQGTSGPDVSKQTVSCRRGHIGFPIAGRSGLCRG